MKSYLNILKCLGDANRLRILLMLEIRPLCVCEISEVLNIALSTISAHLKLLKSSGLIEDEKDGRWVIYRLVRDNDFFNELLNILKEKLQNDEEVIHDRTVISHITREICALKLKEKLNT
ncbi:MAG: ArsR family transcriptional regulator [Spirochaetes bacterium DG_61]|jgi:ArsR family transcriptional regulator|nr:MAG: ArsR family transcriptional regulator [Spirochaetes bacterium DG_61]